MEQDPAAIQEDNGAQPAPDVDGGADRPIDPQPQQTPSSSDPNSELQDEANDIARHDLAAQQSMATSTDELVESAWWQVGIGVTALLLLALTVYYTKQAASHAGVTLQVANDTLENARTISQRELRAYVLVETAAIDHGDRNRKCRAKVVLINRGQTPAYDITYRAKAALVPIGLAGDFPLPEKTTAGGIRGPQQTLDIWATIIGTDDKPLFGNIEYKEFTAFCWGRVDFKDAFGNPRWIAFHFFQKARNAGSMSPSPDRNKTSESQEFSNQSPT